MLAPRSALEVIVYDGGDILTLDIGDDEGVTDAAGKNESQLAPSHFFILAHQVDKLIRRPALIDLMLTRLLLSRMAPISRSL